MKITVLNRQRAVRADLPWLRKFARQALAECVKHPARTEAVLPQLTAVAVTLISDDEIAAVHSRFFNIEGPTDVISFDHGEILISAETARANAARFRTTARNEMALYIVHGLLHLNGFEDEAPRDAVAMRRIQTKIFRQCLSEMGKAWQSKASDPQTSNRRTLRPRL
jgi:probable rRNA maturation factor